MYSIFPWYFPLSPFCDAPLFPFSLSIHLVIAFSYNHSRISCSCLVFSFLASFFLLSISLCIPSFTLILPYFPIRYYCPFPSPSIYFIISSAHAPFALLAPKAMDKRALYSFLNKVICSRILELCLSSSKPFLHLSLAPFILFVRGTSRIRKWSLKWWLQYLTYS